MNVGTLINDLTIFVLAILLGFEVISRVPATLHTPLMSGTNSIHGIVLVGAIALGAAADNPLTGIVAFVAVVFAGANVVGGYWSPIGCCKCSNDARSPRPTSPPND